MPKDDYPPLLIEEWLPIAEIGEESQRERRASNALPPLYFLHVWWTRKPLAACRAAVLGSLLPQYNADWPDHLHTQFPTEETYRQWFKSLLGILGDPVAARKLILDAKDKGIRLKGNPYGYPRAFTISPDEEKIETVLDLLEYNWGSRDISMSDPMAGGGSIPFEALRYGLTVHANELNPVGAVILVATLDYPARFGPALAEEIKKWGREIDQRAASVLERFYPMLPGERIRRYLWARTVACPSTGKSVPLGVHWWLRKGDDPVAVRLICDENAPECRFEIVRGQAVAESDPDRGTISRGRAISPWSGDTIDSQYIKAEAQAGRMGQLLYALSIRTAKGSDFRLPNAQDLEGVRRAEEALAERLPIWEAAGLIPREPFPEVSNDLRPLLYGMPTWADMFSPRQLLALGTYLEVLRDVAPEMTKELPADRARAVETYLGLAFDKAIDRSCYACGWIPQRGRLGHRFDRHDFSLRWSYGEMTLARDGFPWCVDQICNAYRGLAKLADSARSPLFSTAGVAVVERLRVTQANATSLEDLPGGSLHLVCVDPPYYDNIMYSELSDFFYVWMKRSIGHLYRDFFTDELTNKDDEAVANVARFASLGPKRRELADQDYQRKMAAVFREIHRVLRPDGVLTIMFTHKRLQAWDTLATALIEAGFAIKTSWPIHTEFEHSLNQAKKNAARSTILLVCRKRPLAREPVWWDEIRGQVRKTAREKARQFQEQGIRGVDLYLSTFGPVLSIISENWPVLTSEVDNKTGDPLHLRPQTALDVAREEIVALRKQGLLLGRTVEFDPVTDWYIIAWDAFQAQEFPADEARKLSIALGLDIERDLVSVKRVITKKQQFVVFQLPTARRKRGMIDPELDYFDCWLDAVHTTMLVYQEDGAPACGRFLNRSGLRTDGTFKACLQALLNAIPRTKRKGKFLRKEAELLESLRLSFFDDLQPPVEEEPPEVVEQISFPGLGEESPEQDETEVNEDDESEAD